MTPVDRYQQVKLFEPEPKEPPVQGLISCEMLHDIEFTEFPLPDNPDYLGFKSYEPYELITAQSVQLCLQYQAVTDSNGFRLLDGRYLVAVGTFCNAPCGTYIDLILENGFDIPCIVGDIKADVHTDETNTFTVASMCASEFIVDDTISPAAWYGDISMVYEEWNSKIHSIRYNIDLILLSEYPNCFAISETEFIYQYRHMNICRSGTGKLNIKSLIFFLSS